MRYEQEQGQSNVLLSEAKHLSKTGSRFLAALGMTAFGASGPA
jgi:hypothetical protein